MPHLSELQKKYQTNLQIISISDEDLETVQAFLKRPTKEDDSSTFAQLTNEQLLLDDGSRSLLHVDYLKAAQAGQNPWAFIVGKSGVIEWIGHPMEIDEPLDQVINDRWDRVAYVKKKEAEEKVAADIEKRVREAHCAACRRRR